MPSERETAGEQRPEILDDVDTVALFRERRKETVTLLPAPQIGTAKVGRGLRLGEKAHLADEFRTLGPDDDSSAPTDLIRFRYDADE